MGRLYVVDAYNLVLQDSRLDDVVHTRGLEEARRQFRVEAEQLARRAGCRVRLIYDGARGPFEHLDGFENEFVEASFTSTGEKADERVVAVALEMVRRGAHVCVVSDDEEGVRRPLRGASVTLMGTREFTRLLRPPADGAAEESRAEAMSRREQEALARDMLARDATRTRPDERDEDGWAEIPKAELPPIPPAPAPRAPRAPRPGTEPTRPAAARTPPSATTAAPRGTSPPAASASPPKAAPTRPAPPDPAQRLEAKKARGARKQEKRLALLQSLHPTHPSKKPKR